MVLHEKHPVFKKLEIITLKDLLAESSIVYLQTDQVLYKMNNQDDFVYFVLFGWVRLCTSTQNRQLNTDLLEQ